MEPQSIFYLLLGLLAFDYIFEQVLDYLNHKSEGKGIPKELEDDYNNIDS